MLRPALALLLAAGAAHAHGGVFLGPNAGVPPGLRGPADPEPPPPPPRAPWDPGGVVNPSMPEPAPADVARDPAPTVITFASWRFWWAYANRALLTRKDRPPPAGTAERIVPALVRVIEDPETPEDVATGATIALGKMGGTTHVPLLESVLYGAKRGRDARAAAAHALGLLQGLDEGARARVRATLLHTFDDPGVPRRVRSFAAVSLGLGRDPVVLPSLLERLERDYRDDDLPAALLVALGLARDGRARAPLEEYLLDLTTKARRRSFALYALAKLGDPASRQAVRRVLVSRRYDPLTHRGAVLALGAMPGDDAAAMLTRTIMLGRDATATNLAVAALGRLEGGAALLTDMIARGTPDRRAVAALALAARDPAVAGRGEILALLARHARATESIHLRSAFVLARGVARDRNAVHDLAPIAASRRQPPALRHYACLALGLIGDAGSGGVVSGALRQALAHDNRWTWYVRSGAALGFGLLRDARHAPMLVDRLRGARHFEFAGALATALGAIGSADAVDPLVAMMLDSKLHPMNRGLAAAALGLIGDPRLVPPLARVTEGYNYRASVADLDELLFLQ